MLHELYGVHNYQYSLVFVDHYEALILSKNFTSVAELSMEIWAIAERYSSFIPSKMTWRISLAEECLRNLNVKWQASIKFFSVSHKIQHKSPFAILWKLSSNGTRNTTAVNSHHLKVRVGYQSNQKLLHHYQHSKNQLNW